MRIERFLELHGLVENPFASAEEAKDDQILTRLIATESFHYGHPQWPKFCGSPPGSQTSIVFGAKGSGKTAMRLAFEQAVAHYNEENAEPDKKTLLVDYSEFNAFLTKWEHLRNREIKQGRTVWSRFFGRRARLANMKDDWSLTHHVDAIIARICAELLSSSEVLRAADARRWPTQLKFDLLFLIAAYLPERTGEYMRHVRRCHRELFTPMQRAGQWLWSVLRWFPFFLPGALHRLHANDDASVLEHQIQILDHQHDELRRALRLIPRRYRNREGFFGPESDASIEHAHYGALEKVLEIAEWLGYNRVTVVVDRVDEPEMVSGSYEKMWDFIRPLLNNKVLQMPHISFKMLLPVQVYQFVRKSSAEENNLARLDKANLIYPLDWAGELLFELFSERGTVCLGEPGGEFHLGQIFSESIGDDAVIQVLEKLGRPRQAGKFLNSCVADACQHLLRNPQEGGRPVVPPDVFYAARAKALGDLKAYEIDYAE